MHGLFIGFGDITENLSEGKVRDWNSCPINTNIHVLSSPNQYFLAVLSPKGEEKQVLIAWSEDRKWAIVVDGYIIVKSIASKEPHKSHLIALIEVIKSKGISEGLLTIASGSFNGAVIDAENNNYYVFNDRTGSIPLHHAQSAIGSVFSTNPVSLISSGLLSHEIDYTACAELAFIGYTIGSRYFSKTIKIFPPASILKWRENEHRASSKHSVLKYKPSPQTLKNEEMVDRVAESIKTTCLRISDQPYKFAHLQSAGMDSRLILASWPDNHPIPCYTYGNHNSFEAMVAKTIAETKGSTFNYFRPSGDQISENLDTMFGSSGMMVYPDRFAIAKQICNDGYNAILDGFLGGALAGFYYTFDQHLFPSNFLRLFLIFKDQKISKIGLEELTNVLFNEISIKDKNVVYDYFNYEVASKLESKIEDIKHDIYEELKIHEPQNDSVAILYRNFKIANRAIHAISMQGVMSRQFVQVYLPFSGDLHYNDLILNLDPEDVAYKKFYISLFKKHFPSYAELLYGQSKLPLKRSLLAHKWSSRLKKKGINIPYLTGNDFGLNQSPNNWDSWLKESPALRNKAINYFNADGIGNHEQVNKIIGGIADGSKQGSGKIFHLAGIANWLRF